jgi:hypothetical protein
MLGATGNGDSIQLNDGLEPYEWEANVLCASMVVLMNVLALCYALFAPSGRRQSLTEETPIPCPWELKVLAIIVYALDFFLLLNVSESTKLVIVIAPVLATAILAISLALRKPRVPRNMVEHFPVVWLIAVVAVFLQMCFLWLGVAVAADHLSESAITMSWVFVAINDVLTLLFVAVLGRLARTST